MRLSVIIPAYNESARIGRSLVSIDGYLDREEDDYEILVVNDGSLDDTSLVVREIARVRPKIRLIETDRNHGKGAAIRRGFLEAKGDHVLFVDADGSTAIEHIELARPHLESGSEIVIGSRHPFDRPGAGQIVSQPIWKRACGSGANLLIQVLLLPGIWDSQCAFKVFSRRAAGLVAEHATVERWLFDVEALLIARRFGIGWTVIPVKWNNDPDTRVGIRGYLISMREIARLAGRRFRGHYSPISGIREPRPEQRP